MSSPGSLCGGREASSVLDRSPWLRTGSSSPRDDHEDDYRKRGRNKTHKQITASCVSSVEQGVPENEHYEVGPDKQGCTNAAFWRPQLADYDGGERTEGRQGQPCKSQSSIYPHRESESRVRSYREASYGGSHVDQAECGGT